MAADGWSTGVRLRAAIDTARPTDADACGTEIAACGAWEAGGMQCRASCDTGWHRSGHPDNAIHMQTTGGVILVDAMRIVAASASCVFQIVLRQPPQLF